MLFERMLLLGLVLVAFFMIILPLYRFFQPYFSRAARDPVKEAKIKSATAEAGREAAKIRLAAVEAEVEAAKINKKTEEYYDKLYDEALADSKDEDSQFLKKKV